MTKINAEMNEKLRPNSDIKPKFWAKNPTGQPYSIFRQNAQKKLLNQPWKWLELSVGYCPLEV